MSRVAACRMLPVVAFEPFRVPRSMLARSVLPCCLVHAPVAPLMQPSVIMSAMTVCAAKLVSTTAATEQGRARDDVGRRNVRQASLLSCIMARCIMARTRKLRVMALDIHEPVLHETRQRRRAQMDEEVEAENLGTLGKPRVGGVAQAEHHLLHVVRHRAWKSCGCGVRAEDSPPRSAFVGGWEVMREESTERLPF